MFPLLAERRPGYIKIEGTRSMVLNPLAEIVIAVLMAVSIGGGQFMLHVLCNGEGRKGHEEENQTERQAGS